MMKVRINKRERILCALEQLRDQDLLMRVLKAADSSDADGVLTYDEADLSELREL